jgi:hypothetical protein
VIPLCTRIAGRVLHPLPTPLLPAEALSVLSPPHMAPDLLFYPVFEGGSGKSTTAMHIAVALLQAGQRGAAYRAALTEIMQERVPLQCAETQNNLEKGRSAVGRTPHSLKCAKSTNLAPRIDKVRSPPKGDVPGGEPKSIGARTAGKCLAKSDEFSSIVGNLKAPSDICRKTRSPTEATSLGVGGVPFPVFSF